MEIAPNPAQKTTRVAAGPALSVGGPCARESARERLAAIRAEADAAVARGLRAQREASSAPLGAARPALVRRCAWTAANACLSACFFAFIVMSASGMAFPAGFVDGSNAPVVFPAWGFLAFFAGACAISSAALAGAYYSRAGRARGLAAFCVFFAPVHWAVFALSRAGFPRPGEPSVVDDLPASAGVAAFCCRLRASRGRGDAGRGPLYYMTLTAVFCAVFLLFNFGFGQFRVFAGWSIEADAMVYVLTLIVIDRARYALAYALAAPLLALPLAHGILNPAQGAVEYLLTYWVLSPAAAFPALNGALVKAFRLEGRTAAARAFSTFLFGAFVLALFAVKAFLHVWAGAVWWTNGDWAGSLALNALAVFGSFGICAPFAMAAIPAVLRLREANAQVRRPPAIAGRMRQEFGRKAAAADSGAERAAPGLRGPA